MMCQLHEQQMKRPNGEEYGPVLDALCRSSVKQWRQVSLIASVLILITWCLALTVSISCAISRPHSELFRPIWEQNYLHPSALTLDGVAGAALRYVSS